MRIETFWIIFFLLNSTKCLKDKIIKSPSNELNIEEIYSDGHDFKCKIIPPSTNVTSVHKLRISDIKAIAAFGDSLSTGFAVDAENFYSVLKDYRGLSFSAGGDEKLETLVTLPNIMKKYNKDLIGYSTNINVFYRKSSNHFNVAISRQQAKDFPTQARELVTRMKNSKDFDYKNEWKLITIFFGSLDLCHYCSIKKIYSVQKFASYMNQGLNILYNQLPKTFVNLIAPMKLNKLTNESFSNACKKYQNYVCMCGLYPKDENAEIEFLKLHKQYVNYIHDSINSNRYEKDDFTVVVQPFLQELELPRTNTEELDSSYLAIDCLHFSRKGQQQLAISLWNSMFTSIKNKKTNWYLTFELKCPTLENPYLCTRKNNC
jgi:phospholipase B1